MHKEALLTIITIHKGDFCNLEKTLYSLENLGALEVFTELIVVSAESQLFDFSNHNLLGYKQVLNVNHGIFNAMNIGLKLATGKYINFLNSGDALLKEIDSLEVLNTLQGDQNWLVAQSLRKNTKSEDYIIWSLPQKQIKFLLAINSYCHQSTFVSRKILVQLGGFDESSSVSDWGISLRLKSLCEPFVLKSFWALYQGSGFSENPNWTKWAKDVSHARRLAKGPILNNAKFDLLFQQFISLALRLKRKIYL